MARRDGLFTDLLNVAYKLRGRSALRSQFSRRILHLVAAAFSRPVTTTTFADMSTVVIHSGVHAIASIFIRSADRVRVGAVMSFIKTEAISWGS